MQRLGWVSYLVNFRSPPLQILRRSSVENREENDNTSDRDRAVESGAQDEVISPPPGRLLSLDEQAEKQADDSPTAIVGP